MKRTQAQHCVAATHDTHTMASEGKGDDKVQPPEGCAPVFISSSDMEKLGYVIEKEYTAQL